MQLVVTNTAVANTTILSSEFNENMDDITTWANGNIGADNFTTMTDVVEWNVSSAAKALDITSSSSAAAIDIAKSGTGKVINIANTGSGKSIDIDNAGAGTSLEISNAGSSAKGIDVTNSGTGHSVEINNSSTGTALKITDSGSGGAKAAVEVISTTKGFLGPRMTSAQRDAIDSPPEGLEIYNSDQKCKQIYTGTAWINIGPQTGDLVPSGRASAAGGYLACDGSAVSRTTYADLFAAVGTSFGAGNGTTTFNVPDTSRRVLVGSGGSGSATLANTIGSTGGEESHTLSAEESGTTAHSHGYTDPGHDHFVKVYAGGGTDGNNRTARTNDITLVGNLVGITSTDTIDITINNASAAAASSAHNNIQPSLVIAHYIKY